MAQVSDDQDAGQATPSGVEVTLPLSPGGAVLVSRALRDYCLEAVRMQVVWQKRANGSDAAASYAAEQATICRRIADASEELREQLYGVCVEVDVALAAALAQ